MQLTLNESAILVMSLLLGSPALILVGLIGAALTVVLENAGILLGLLLLPLYIPILILGESAVISATSAEPAVFQLTLLAAISVLAITLAPHAASAALKVAME
jgi:heme exporter protein B